MLLQEALQQVLQHLEKHGVNAALLGGLAVSVWTEPRFTRDVDLAVFSGSFNLIQSRQVERPPSLAERGRIEIHDQSHRR